MVLTGDKVILGALIQSDAQALYAWMNDPAIALSNGCWRPTDGMDFSNWFQAIGKDANRVTFAIRKKGERAAVGYLSILSIHSVFRSAEMGVTIGPEALRNQGLGRDAMALGLRYCWNHLNLERVTLRIYGDNPAAIRCYQAVGFQVEGVLRRAVFLGGQRLDVTMMGALRDPV